jgi:hypothetical protein
MLGALIGAGLNIAASAIGSAIANKRKREAEQKYQAGINEQIDELNDEINGNFLDRADARNALRKVTDANTETLRQLNTDAIRGGATDEAKVAMASKLNKQTADVVGDLAAIGEQRKDALRGQKRNLKLGLLQHQYAQDADTSGIDSIVQGVGAAANAIGSAWGTKNDTPTDTTAADTTSANTTAVKATYDPDRLKPQPTIPEGIPAENVGSKAAPTVNKLYPNGK